MFRFQHWIY